jgi:hypothetical protein
MAYRKILIRSAEVFPLSQPYFSGSPSPILLSILPGFTLPDILNFNAMKKWIKFMTVVFLVGIIGAGFGYKFVYNKPHRDYEKAKADYSISGKELFLQFKNSTPQAGERYTGKVLEIKGQLASVETPDSLTIAVFTLDEGMFGAEGIRCSMLPNHAQHISQFIGAEVKLKGYCTGYNETDVIMEKCSIIN